METKESNATKTNNAAETKESKSDKYTFLKFGATWCAPCKRVAPFVESLVGKYVNVEFITYDIDNDDEITEDYNIVSVPTFILLLNGDEVNRYVGANTCDIEGMLNVTREN